MAANIVFESDLYIQSFKPYEKLTKEEKERIEKGLVSEEYKNQILINTKTSEINGSKRKI